jgi:sulfate adenylyltransferase subunit 2
MDVWQYIERENLGLPSIYFAHNRPVVMRGGAIVPVNVPLVSGEVINPPKAGEEVIDMQVRFRTVGDITCTAPVISDADNVSNILLETATTTITERGATRLDDQTSDASMEQRKKEGYF